MNDKVFDHPRSVVVYNFGRAMRFVCITGFLNTADRMVWPPSLSRGRKCFYRTGVMADRNFTLQE